MRPSQARNGEVALHFWRHHDPQRWVRHCGKRVGVHCDAERYDSLALGHKDHGTKRSVRVGGRFRICAAANLCQTAELIQGLMGFSITGRRSGVLAGHLAEVFANLPQPHQDIGYCFSGDGHLGPSVVAQDGLNCLGETAQIWLAVGTTVRKLPGSRPAGIAQVGEAASWQVVLGVE